MDTYIVYIVTNLDSLEYAYPILRIFNILTGNSKLMHMLLQGRRCFDTIQDYNYALIHKELACA